MLIAAIHGDDIVGIIVAGLMMMIPIIGILTRHQQKMALIFQNRQRDQSDAIRHSDERVLAEMAAIRAEMRQLKDLVHTQMLAMDAMPSRPPAPPVDVQERLHAGD